ncbi:MAG: M55 family metallopeptidase [Cyclobacteriaceae bacterium]
MKHISFILCFSVTIAVAQSPKIFISVDMEGIGGIGTPKMVSSSGKDYATGRKLMTAEVNAVVEAIFAAGNATVLVNDSHGDMQNLLHTELDPRAEYLQSNIKPLGMVQGLDDSFDAAIFIGYHTRAGTENGFLAHTGSGSVKGLWINGVEVGEGGLNAYFAGALGVPVILASGDKAFADQFSALVSTRTVATKTAVGSSAAKLRHPSVVLADLKKMTTEALKDLKNAKTLDTTNPVTFRIKTATTTRADVCMSIPGMKRIDGYTIEYDAKNMDEAYRLIRVIYKYIRW